MTVFFCISSRNDPALAILERLLLDHPIFDAHILVEDEDPNLSGPEGKTQNLGPNPKIRNMSRAYREARGDIIWIIDCNVWVDTSVAGRMVDLLCGFRLDGSGPKYKFVHQLPLVVDLSGTASEESEGLSSSAYSPNSSLRNAETNLSRFGGFLDEMFFSTSHAKFYTAISTVAVAPCIVGKSNMFRRSHLNALTESNSARDPGIDYFSENICEDHLIGDLLWKSRVPEHVSLLAGMEGQSPGGRGIGHESKVIWGNHGLLRGSLVIQPTRDLSVRSYLARRIRWLRVRKFTVVLATLVEPGTESLLCSLYGAFGLTTLSWCSETLEIPRTWLAFCTIWIFSIFMWCLVDWQLWRFLQSGKTIKNDASVPTWVTGKRKGGSIQWLLAWFGREIFAFPIWLWAVVGGVTVVWRGRRFWVGMDMKVYEIDRRGTESREDMGFSDVPHEKHVHSNSDGRKKRVD